MVVSATISAKGHRVRASAAQVRPAPGVAEKGCRFLNRLVPCSKPRGVDSLRSWQPFGPDLCPLGERGGGESHHFVRSVASICRHSPGRQQRRTERLEVEVGERVAPRHLVLSLSPVRLPGLNRR